MAQVAQVTGRHKTLASCPYEWGNVGDPELQRLATVATGMIPTDCP